MSGGAAVYRGRTPVSEAVWDRATHSMPGGNTRSAIHHAPYPLTMARGAGFNLWDVDGNKYVDLSNNLTSLVHGHAHDGTQVAMMRQLQRGTQWAHNSEPAVELAEALCTRIGSVERVRFTNSGSEATLLAARLARAATGRPFVLVATNGYHGTRPIALPLPGGGEVCDTLVARYGDLDDFQRVFDAQPGSIAAVMIEAVQSSGGMAAATPAFFQDLAALAHRAGALFILDEVVTLRLAAGGQQEKLQLSPDLTLMGKLIGGGLPIGAVGGPARLMDALDPRQAEYVRHAGTYNGNPMSCAAGLATLSALTPSEIDRIDSLAERLGNGLLKAAQDLHVPLSLRRHGSLINVFLSPTPPEDMRQRLDSTAITQFHVESLARGVACAPRGLMCTSTAMTTAVVDDVLDRLGEALSATSSRRPGA